MSVKGAPFGRLYQHEWDYFARTGMSALSRHVYATLVVRAGPTRIVTDRIESLMRWSGLSSGKVRACLKDLETRGVVRRRRTPMHDGRGSFATKTELVAYETWPGVSDQPPRAGEWSATNSHRSDDQPPQNDRPTATATRHNPDVPSRFSSRESGLPLAVNEEADEDAGIERFAESQASWWRDARRVHRGKYADGVALRWLKDAIRGALGRGYEKSDIALVLDAHAPDEWADPRDLGHWLEDDRREAELEALEERRAAARQAQQKADFIACASCPHYRVEHSTTDGCKAVGGCLCRRFADPPMFDQVLSTV